MKKSTSRYYWIHCRKWIVTWTILILILSLISLSAGSGNDTEKHENTGTDSVSKAVTEKDVQAGTNTEEDPATKEETESGTDSQKTDSESHEKNSKTSVSTDDQESSGETQLTESDSEESTDTRESTAEDLKAKEEIDDSTETVSEKDTSGQESLEESTEIETKAEQDTDSQENFDKNSETNEVESGSTDKQQSSENNLLTTTETEQDTDDQGSTEKSSEVQTGVKDDISSQGSTEENSESEIKTETVTDDQENSQKSQETGNAESCSTENLKSSCKSTSSEAEAKEKSDSTGNSETNLKLKTCTDNEKDSEKDGTECSGTVTELETGSYDGSKNPEAVEVETEGTANSGETNQSDELETLINIDGSNWSYIKINGSKLANSGENSWYNLQYILSHSSTLRSIYTTHESVKINYKGSEALGGQKVNIYLIKTRSPSFSEADIKNITDDSTISFEDILSKNPEYYLQIPETLNAGGDLSPMTLGPLPEGSYWIFITLAENETNASETNKAILLAHSFKVLEYDMRAEVPSTLEAGENLEVNLVLKNVPAQKNYTCCALLMREDTSRTNSNISSENISSDTNGMEPISGTFAEGIRIMEYCGFNETNYESETGKNNIQKEIQTLIGKGNGMISMGEENQNTLPMPTSDLPHGNYLLLVGAYENGKGLAGIAQAEISICDAKK